MNDPFDDGLGAALLGFNGETVLYCQGISDMIAQEYASDYARMLQNRARGVEFSLPRFPHGLFEPNRNLIRSNLEKISEKNIFLESNVRYQCRVRMETNHAITASARKQFTRGHVAGNFEKRCRNPTL